MYVNDGFDNGKAQASTISFALTREVYAVKAIEQFGKVLSSDIRAGVFDGHYGFVALTA